VTTRLEAVEALVQHFVGVWGAEYPYTLEGEDYTPPDGPWARFSVRHSIDHQHTIGPVGARKFERRAICYAQIYTPTNRGTRAARTLAQRVADGFEAISITGSTIYTTAATVRESEIDGRWLQMIVSIPLTYHETR